MHWLTVIKDRDNVGRLEQYRAAGDGATVSLKALLAAFFPFENSWKTSTKEHVHTFFDKLDASGIALVTSSSREVSLSSASTEQVPEGGTTPNPLQHHLPGRGVVVTGALSTYLQWRIGMLDVVRANGKHLRTSKDEGEILIRDTTYPHLAGGRQPYLPEFAGGTDFLFPGDIFAKTVVARVDYLPEDPSSTGPHAVRTGTGGILGDTGHGGRFRWRQLSTVPPTKPFGRSVPLRSVTAVYLNEQQRWQK